MLERGRILFVAAVLAGLLLVGSLIWRSTVNRAQRLQERAVDTLICKRLHVLDVTLERIVAADSQRSALIRFRYYRDHQDELGLAIASGRRTVANLKRADCAPSKLPTAP